MARPRTVTRVHHAVLDLVNEHGHKGLTMEGIAARAGVGKQTLYRTWPSVPAILFDALLARASPDVNLECTGPTGATDAGSTADPAATSGGRIRQAPTPESPSGTLFPELLESLLQRVIEEIDTEPNESLFRSLAAAIQHDPELAREYRERLMAPQLAQFHALFHEAGINRAEEATELLLAPIFYRWFMRTPALNDREIGEHVRRVLHATS